MTGTLAVCVAFAFFFLTAFNDLLAFSKPNKAIEVTIPRGADTKQISQILEDEGLISSHAGAKSCASVTPEQMVGIRSQLLETDAQTLVEAMKQMGVTREEALELIKKLW